MVKDVVKALILYYSFSANILTYLAEEEVSNWLFLSLL